MKYQKHNHTGTNTPEALNLLLDAAQDGTLGLRNDTVHIAVFITDGRPHIKHLHNQSSNASKATMAAAKRLHESNIYHHVYAVGIEGNKQIISKFLEYIAYPSSLVFHIAGFNADLFEELGRNLTLQFCDGKIIAVTIVKYIAMLTLLSYYLQDSNLTVATQFCI